MRDFIFELPSILTRLSASIRDILGRSIDIGGTEISVLGLIAGVGLLAVVIFSIIK